MVFFDSNKLKLIVQILNTIKMCSVFMLLLGSTSQHGQDSLEELDRVEQIQHLPEQINSSETVTWVELTTEMEKYQKQFPVN